MANFLEVVVSCTNNMRGNGCGNDGVFGKRAVLFLFLSVILLGGDVGQAADIFLRFKVKEPVGEHFRVDLSGHRHRGNPWNLPGQAKPKFAEVAGNVWSDWIDLRQWPLHGRLNRVGGLAEWPSIRFDLSSLEPDQPVEGCTFEVQLADQPDEEHVVISFTESSETNGIGFLAVHPLHEHRDEFETGSQMADRHLRWAMEIVGDKPPELEKVIIATGIWAFMIRD